MEFKIISEDPVTHISDCLVVGVYEGPALSTMAEQIDAACDQRINNILEAGDLKGTSGQTLILHDLPGIKAKRVLLVGCGKKEEFNTIRLRDAAYAAGRLLEKSGTTKAVFCLPDPNDGKTAEGIRHVAEAISSATYRFDQTKSKKKPPTHPLELIEFAVDKKNIDAANTAAQTGAAIGAGIALARDLGNLPGNICTPTYLAEQAIALSKEFAIDCEILEESDMEKLGMGSLLSVSRGSRQPAKLIIMKYNGGGSTEAPIVLVGKGLTFDAGGISLKPAAAMDEMKYDMCGGASVFGTMKAVALLKLPINLIGIVPSSENLPDGEANKPGDVVTSMSGQTIEILNTDAEGRLILCDALTYTERFKPKAVVDIATLTGACVIALGSQANGLFSNNDKLAKELLECGETAADRSWRLPIWDEYQKQLDSNFADMANIGGRGAGAITAACFLSRYTEEFKWAHLDIAGTAWTKGKTKGATGRPVGLLTQYCISQCKNNS